MPNIFNKIDRLKPVYDRVYNFVLLLCKILLVVDIFITCMAVSARHLAKYVSFIHDPPWSEEIVLTCMAYMAVLSASLAIRRGAHIRMTALDHCMPKNVVRALDVLADFAVLVLAFIMLFVGWKYAITLGAKGTYVSMPTVSKFWMYFPVPLAGAAMIIFELEALYHHIKCFFIQEVTNV